MLSARFDRPTIVTTGGGTFARDFVAAASKHMEITAPAEFAYSCISLLRDLEDPCERIRSPDGSAIEYLFAGVVELLECMCCSRGHLEYLL